MPSFGAVTWLQNSFLALGAETYCVCEVVISPGEEATWVVVVEIGLDQVGTYLAWVGTCLGVAT